MRKLCSEHGCTYQVVVVQVRRIRLGGSLGEAVSPGRVARLAAGFSHQTIASEAVQGSARNKLSAEPAK